MSTRFHVLLNRLGMVPKTKEGNELLLHGRQQFNEVGWVRTYTSCLLAIVSSKVFIFTIICYIFTMGSMHLMRNTGK